MRDDPAVTDLLIRASGGDRQAWDALVERYAPLIWGICRGHRLRDAHAEDVGQAVWLHLAGHLDSLRDPAPLAGWLATTTRRECHRVLRAMRDLPAARRELQNMPDDQTAAEHELLAAERAAALREAFAHLPPAGQRLLAMLISDPPTPDTTTGSPMGARQRTRACGVARGRGMALIVRRGMAGVPGSAAAPRLAGVRTAG